MILVFFCTTGISFLCTDYIGHLFHDACVIFCCLLVLCLLAHGFCLYAILVTPKLIDIPYKGWILWNYIS